MEKVLVIMVYIIHNLLNANVFYWVQSISM